jgi:uncharacterized protein YgiM (DUF1202 family)
VILRLHLEVVMKFPARRLLRAALVLGAFMVVLAMAAPSLASPRNGDANASAQASTATATATQSRVNVWIGPGQGFWWIGALRLNETVPLLGVSADQQWWQVKTRFGTGWLWYLDATTSTTDVPVVSPGPIGRITAGRVIVRGGPGVGALAVGSMSTGMQFFVLATRPDGSWLKIRYRFGIGWIAASTTDLAGATPAQTGAPAVEGPRAIINTSALTVRTGPGFGFAAIGVLSGGEVVPIIGRTTDGIWLQVTTRFGTGWINMNFVITKDYFGSAPITESQAANAPTATPTFLVLTGTVNVRTGPNVAFPVMLTVNAGTRLPILGQSRDRQWWQVDTSGGKGWINKQLGQALSAIGNVPVVEP